MLFNERIEQIIHKQVFTFLVEMIESMDHRSLGSCTRILFPYSCDKNQLFSMRFFVLIVELLGIWRTIIFTILESKKRHLAENKLNNVAWVFNKFSGSFYLNCDINACFERDLSFFNKNGHLLDYDCENIYPNQKKVNFNSDLQKDFKRINRSTFQKNYSNDLPVFFSNGDRSMSNQINYNQNRGANFFEKNNINENKNEKKAEKSLFYENKKMDDSLLGEKMTKFDFINDTSRKNDQKENDIVKIENKNDFSIIFFEFKKMKNDFLHEIFKQEAICEVILSKKKRLQEFTNFNYQNIEQFLYLNDKNIEQAQKDLLIDLNLINEIYDIFLYYFETSAIGKKNFDVFIKLVIQQVSKYNTNETYFVRKPEKVYETIFEKDQYDNMIKQSVDQKFQMDSPDRNTFGHTLLKNGENNRFIEEKTTNDGQQKKEVISSIKKVDKFWVEKEEIQNFSINPNPAIKQQKGFDVCFNNEEELNKTTNKNEKNPENENKLKVKNSLFFYENLKCNENTNSRRSSRNSRTSSQNYRISFDHVKTKAPEFRITQEEFEILSQENISKPTPKPFTEFYRNNTYKRQNVEDSNEFYHLSSNDRKVSPNLRPQNARQENVLSNKTDSFQGNMPRRHNQSFDNQKKKVNFSSQNDKPIKNNRFLPSETKYEISEYMDEEVVSRLKERNDSLRKIKHQISSEVSSLSMEKVSHAVCVPLITEREMKKGFEDPTFSKRILQKVDSKNLMREFIKKEDQFGNLKLKYDRMKKFYGNSFTDNMNILQLEHENTKQKSEARLKSFFNEKNENQNAEVFISFRK